MACHLRLRSLALYAAFPALLLPPWAATAAEVLAKEGHSAPHPLSAWIVVPVSITLFLLAIYLCSRLVRRDYCAERQYREEAGDRPVTPVPGGDGGFNFH